MQRDVTCKYLEKEKYNPKSKEDRNPRDFKETDRGACCSMVFTESNHILSSVKKGFTFHCWDHAIQISFRVMNFQDTYSQSRSMAFTESTDILSSVKYGRFLLFTVRSIYRENSSL